ncbi:hypothetical protein, conserved [Plasmodium gonderi]|uniref:Uncharacterized protein n=1 Tax=Plasmodium gonderi TaxID=77519 RepID=A0A1Y1JLW0_PLAGO|nr:hypothetical protein, conserved [Plasmodium gonderi]GAW83451.1 hypothetical protein, conserved [Plasmodium gonderi]
MSKSLKRGEVYFKGVLKYYKKKCTTIRDDVGYGNTSTSMGYVRKLKEKNAAHKNQETRKNINQIVGSLSANRNNNYDLQVDQGDEIEHEQENKEEQEGTHEQLRHRFLKPTDLPLELPIEQSTNLSNATTTISDAREIYTKRHLPDEIFKKRYPPKFRNEDNSHTEDVYVNNPPKFNNTNVSLSEKNGDNIREYSSTFNKKGREKNLAKSRNPSNKKKCVFKKNYLNKKKKNILNTTNSNPLYFDLYHNYEDLQLCDNRSFIKRNKKKVNKQKIKYKYEMPTIASLGKVKKLNYLNLITNENEMSKQEKMFLNNLSHVYFDRNSFHAVAPSSKKLKRRKKQSHL